MRNDEVFGVLHQTADLDWFSSSPHGVFMSQLQFPTGFVMFCNKSIQRQWQVTSTQPNCRRFIHRFVPHGIFAQNPSVFNAISSGFIPNQFFWSIPPPATLLTPEPCFTTSCSRTSSATAPASPGCPGALPLQRCGALVTWHCSPMWWLWVTRLGKTVETGHFWWVSCFIGNWCDMFHVTTFHLRFSPQVLVFQYQPWM